MDVFSTEQRIRLSFVKTSEFREGALNTPNPPRCPTGWQPERFNPKAVTYASCLSWTNGYNKNTVKNKKVNKNILQLVSGRATNVDIYIYIYIYTHTHIHTHIYIYTYIYIYIYMNIRTNYMFGLIQFFSVHPE